MDTFSPGTLHLRNFHLTEVRDGNYRETAAPRAIVMALEVNQEPEPANRVKHEIDQSQHFRKRARREKREVVIFPVCETVEFKQCATFNVSEKSRSSNKSKTRSSAETLWVRRPLLWGTKFGEHDPLWRMEMLTPWKVSNTH